MPVAIDVNIGCPSCSYLTLKLCLSQISGDGQLPTSAAIPGSKANTRFDSLEIYLISYANSLNLTIAGPDANLFVQEPDSTVKHINYNISSCVPSGQYNVRFISFHSFIHIYVVLYYSSLSMKSLTFPTSNISSSLTSRMFISTLSPISKEH